jgi:hypothetical protein
MTTAAITGCRARGYCRRSRRCCGRPQERKQTNNK